MCDCLTKVILECQDFFPQISTAPKHDCKKILLLGLSGTMAQNQLKYAPKPLANKAKREVSPTKLKSYGENIARINYNSRKKL